MCFNVSVNSPDRTLLQCSKSFCILTSDPSTSVLTFKLVSCATLWYIDISTALSV